MDQQFYAVLTIYCSSSCLPWYEIFYLLLNQLAEMLNRSEVDSAVPLLSLLYEKELPDPGVRVDITLPELNEVNHYTFLQ